MKQNLQYLLVFFTSIFAYGQVNIAADTDKKEIAGKETFRFTVIQETMGNDNIQETPLRMPDLSKFNKIGEGSVRNTYVDPQTKTVINQLVYEYVLEPKQAGRFMIGSALVTVNGKIYKSEPFYINVKDGDFNKKSLAENTSENVYLNMELQESEVYKNQPTIAVLRAYSKDFNNLRRVGKVSFPNQQSVEIKPVSYTKSEIEQRADGASQVIAVVMIFPNETGNITIPRASVAYNEEGRKVEKLKSNPVKLSVKKLPQGSPKNFNNAVGNYKLAILNNKKDERIEVNKPIDVVVKMNGEGNLSSAQLPKIINSSDYIAYKPEFTTNVKGGNKGLEGEVSAHYIVVPKKPGNIVINTESFSFFNPEEKKYINLGVQSLVISVMTPEQISAAKSTIEKVNEYTNNVLETVNIPIVETKQYKIQEKHKINWKTLFANYSLIALFVGLLIFIISGLKKMNNLKPKTANVSLGTVAETEMQILDELSVDVDSNIHYLKNQLAEENYSEFFEGFDNLIEDIENQINKSHNLSLKQFLERNKGQKSVEELRELQQQIHIEKYAPLHSKEQLHSILERAEILFSDIA